MKGQLHESMRASMRESIPETKVQATPPKATTNHRARLLVAPVKSADGNPRSLPQNWSFVEERIRSSSRFAIFLDFDGTLVNIAPRPELVRLSPKTRRLLLRLAKHPRATLIVISGRRRGELLRYIKVTGIHYFGLYGWERSEHSPLSPSSMRALQRARLPVEQLCSSIPGLWAENKQFSLSVHLLELSPAAQAIARRKLRSAIRPFHRYLRLIENLRDVEIVPRGLGDKGDAVRRALNTPLARHALPIYFGDDLSDEAAFAALDGGISVRVGAPRATRARYAVSNPAAVAVILNKIDKALV